MKRILFILLFLTSLVAKGQFVNNQPRIFNIKNYGAKGDGIRLFDAVMTGTTTLTSASASFSSATDVGKAIRVPGAGSAGVDLVTTIASVSNATTVILTTTSSTSVSADTIIYGTDNTVAIQAAINAANTQQGGVIYIPFGFYVVAGALQTSIGGQNPNSILYIPNAGLDNNRKRFVIRGEAPPNFTQSLFSNTTIANNGSIIEALTQGSGNMAAVFGIVPSAGPDFNYNYPTYENISILVPLNKGSGGPNIGGISNYWGAALHITNVHIGADGSPNSLTAAPSNEVAGIITNKAGSDDFIGLDNVSVEMFKYGIVANEHARFSQTEILWCTQGFVAPHGNYSLHADLLNIQWCVHSVYVPVNTILGTITAGTVNFNIDLLSMEQYNTGSHWYNAVDEFSDTAGFAIGSLYYDLYQAGTGTKINQSFIKTGGVGFQCWPIGMGKLYYEVPYNFQVGSFGIQTISATNVAISNNAHLNAAGNAWIADTTGGGAWLTTNNGNMFLRLGASVTGGSAFSLLTVWNFNNDKSGGIGGSGAALGSTGYWLNWTTAGNFTSATNNTQDFGASANRWAHVYGTTGDFTNLTLNGGASITSVQSNVASADLTAQSATVSSVATFTPSANGTFRVGCYANITAISAGTLTMTVTFTDENSASKTITFFPMGLTAAGLTATGDTGFPTADLRAKSGTAITVVATFAGVSITYDAGATISQLR